MLSLHNIWTVARFEIKTLLRSWFFRIFAGLAVVGLFVLNLLLLTNVGNSPWIFRGLPASVPYLNLSLLNVVQAVIAVFLASDFLKRDKKLDTTEVVYMRSMTNGDYVFGKTLGIFLVFLGLNLVVLLVAGIFHAAFSDLPFGIKPYLYYPLLISLPTLFYVFGLAFLLMSLIRNQAVTFVVLLGYIGLTLFVLGGKVHHLFDYMSFNVPLMYSDFVGFGDVGKILIHRGIYFCLGVS
ncbi:MAG: xanthan lyase, partial [candidate division KSB1 bacterium]|nr:xanthan lyase [candidate division KSB1 bacterium]